MITTNTNKCPLCGKVGKIVKSNNPLVAGVCLKCLNDQIDYNNIKQADFFCQSYNLPFIPERWLDIAREAEDEVFIHYSEVIGEEYRPNLYYDAGTGALWSKMNDEWKKVLDHNALIREIKPIKEGFIQQMEIKWGPQYSFEEYIHLEDIYTNTVKRAGITNPITLDIVKKLAIVSIGMDKALEEGDIKAASEYSKMHKMLTDSGGLDKLIEVGNSDTINNISDLCDFLEKEGFEMNWNIDVPRDIVDQTIADQQEWVANFVRDSVGIQQTYDIVEKSYREALETNAMNKATTDINLEEIMEATKAGLNKEIDEELESEVFGFDEPDEIDDY